MLRQACTKYKFWYVLEILEIAKEQQVQPNAQFIQHLENLWQEVWDLIKKKVCSIQK